MERRQKENGSFTLFVIVLRRKKKQKQKNKNKNKNKKNISSIPALQSDLYF